MPAISERQRKMMAIASHEPGKLYKRNQGVLKMSPSQLHEFSVKAKKKAAGNLIKKRKAGMK